jgi:hypothetical protein
MRSAGAASVSATFSAGAGAVGRRQDQRLDEIRAGALVRHNAAVGRGRTTIEEAAAASPAATR